MNFSMFNAPCSIFPSIFISLILALMKNIEVVAAIIVHEGSILCVQRGPAKYPYISEKWEFPGGKVEAGETKIEAGLIRL